MDDYILHKGDNLIFALIHASKFSLHIRRAWNQEKATFEAAQDRVRTWQQDEDHSNAEERRPTSKPEQRGLFTWITDCCEECPNSSSFPDLNQVNSERTRRQWQCVTKSAERNRAQNPNTLRVSRCRAFWWRNEDVSCQNCGVRRGKQKWVFTGNSSLTLETRLESAVHDLDSKAFNLS